MDSFRTKTGNRKGKRERARVKKQLFRHRPQMTSVSGAGTFHVKAGRRKYSKICRKVSQEVDKHFDARRANVLLEPLIMKSGCVKQTA